MGISPGDGNLALVPNGPNHDATALAAAAGAVGGAGAVPGRQVMSLSTASSSMGNAVGFRGPLEFDISQGDGDQSIWEPSNWILMREHRAQRDICMPEPLMGHLSLMRENNLRRLW